MVLLTCIFYERFVLSNFTCLLGVLMLLQISFIAPANAQTSTAENTTSIESDVPVTGWDKVNDTAELPSIYVVEGTVISGFESLAVQLVYVPAYKTDSASTTSLAQASENPCTPPVQLPIPLEQKAQVTGLSSLPSTTKYMHTSLIFYSSFWCKNEFHFMHLQHNPPQEAPRFLANIPTTPPFINGFSGLAPPLS